MSFLNYNVTLIVISITYNSIKIKIPVRQTGTYKLLKLNEHETLCLHFDVLTQVQNYLAIKFQC